MKNEICHFEIPAENPEKVIEFYTKIFDWNMEAMHGENMEYWMINTGGPVMGGIMRKTMPEMMHIYYISVESVDEHVKKIQDAGGMIVKEKTVVPGMGWFAVALDPDNNPFAIWQEDKEAPPPE